MNTSLNTGDNAANAIAGNGNTQIYNQIAPTNTSENMPNTRVELAVADRDFAQIERLIRTVDELTKASYELRLEMQKMRGELHDELQREVSSIRQTLAIATRPQSAGEKLISALPTLAIVLIVVFFEWFIIVYK